MTTTRQTMNGKPVFDVPAKSIINMDSGFKQKLLCDGPTFSTGTACAYSCAFCYVPAIMKKSPHLKGITQPHEDIVIRRAGALDAMRQQLLTRGKPRFADPDDTRVIYASPLVDVAANLDLCRETVKACNLILELTHWQIRLLSKSNLLPWIDTHLAQYRDRIIYGVSTGTLNDDLAAAFEKGTPKVSKRLASLHELQERGCRTFGMICPSLPSPVGDYNSFARDMATPDMFRCEHIWAEVINVRGESMTRTCKALANAGFQSIAEALHRVSTDANAWEDYARLTFEAHTFWHPGTKLRFLQYVNDRNRAWWEPRVKDGAVLL